MKKLILIYCLVICLFTTTCLFITLGMTVNKTIKYFAIQSPAFMHNFDDDLNSLPPAEQAAIKNSAHLPSHMSYEAMSKIWKMNRIRYLEQDKHKILSEIYGYFAVIFVNILLLIPHIMIIRKVYFSSKDKK